MSGQDPSLSLAVAMTAGVASQIVARHIRVPGIVVLFLAGVALGPEGIGWVKPSALGSSLYGWVHFAVAIILFEGGLNLEMARLRQLQGPLRRLLFRGGALTWFGAATAAALFLGWSPSMAMLFGSLVVVTGPTVVSPLLRELRFKTHVRSMLEAEGVLIDPLGVLLAALALQIALVPHARTIGLEVANVALRIGVGAAAGAVVGGLLALLLRTHRLIPRGLENVLVLAVVVLLYHAIDGYVPHSGILAVTVAGIVVGNAATRVDRDLREFKDQLTMLLIGFVFVLLAADVRLADVEHLGNGGWLVVASLVLVVRPASVWLSTWGTELGWRERVLASWIAPRGIVAAAVASSTAAALAAEGIEGGAELRALVFLTIAVTVGLAGLTAAPLGSLLKLRLRERTAVAVLGAGGLGLALGEELKHHGSAVVFLDEDPRRCRRATEAGFRVVLGDALRERSLLLARIEEVGRAVGMTSNDHLNTLFAATACELYRVPEGYVALSSSGTAEDHEQIDRFGGKVLFEAAHDRTRWDLRARNDELEIVRVPFVGLEPAKEATEEGAASGAGREAPSRPTVKAGSVREPYVILGVLRGSRFHVMTRRFELAPGDVASCAIYAPAREAALAALAAAGFGEPKAEET